MPSPNLLDRWSLTIEDLTVIVDENPSLRGPLIGYIGEYKARETFKNDPRVSGLKKFDDHDRTKKSDFVFQYRGTEISVEVKSLQTNSIKRPEGGRFEGRFQCDASDRRSVKLPNGKKVETTCLLIGEWDLIAVNLFAFTNEWRFVYARNCDLPCSTYGKYSLYVRRHLLASTVRVTWPAEPPFVTDPFPLLDQIVREKKRAS